MEIEYTGKSDYKAYLPKFSARHKMPIPEVTLASDAFLAKTTGQIGYFKKLLPEASSSKDRLHLTRQKEVAEARKNKSTNRFERKKIREKLFKSNEKFSKAFEAGKADLNHFKHLLGYKLNLTPTERWGLVGNMREIISTKRKEEASRSFSSELDKTRALEQRGKSSSERDMKYREKEIKAEKFRQESSKAAEGGVENLQDFLCKRQLSLPIFLESWSATKNRKLGVEEMARQGIIDNGDVKETWEPRVSAYVAKEGAKHDPKIPDTMLKTYLGQTVQTQKYQKSGDIDKYSADLTIKNLGNHSGAVVAVMPEHTVIGYVEGNELSKPAYSNIPWVSNLDRFMKERYTGIKRSYSEPVRSKI